MSNGANRCTASQSHFSGLALTALVCGQFANDGPFNSVSVLQQLRVAELYLCSYIMYVHVDTWKTIRAICWISCSSDRGGLMILCRDPSYCGSDMYRLLRNSCLTLLMLNAKELAPF